MKMNELFVDFGGGWLLQVANRSTCMMNSYFIKTPEGKNVIMDGGYYGSEDAQHLLELIKDNGGVVDIWFITHAHSDHYGALSWMLEHSDKLDIEIKELYYTFPDIDWLEKAEDPKVRPLVETFYAGVEKHSLNVKPLIKDSVIECGGMTFEILNDIKGYEDIKVNPINNTSIVIMAHFPKRNVLFLADLGVEAGDAILQDKGEAAVRCDIVQMAHHGQQGVNRRFYEAVQPKLCLFPTTDWIWNNDFGNGPGTGHLKIDETRKWMEELGAVAMCLGFMGDYLLK